jgi:4-amino-4-deoxy-L-arabinose transferase-like glycosyltransferase
MWWTMGAAAAAALAFLTKGPVGVILPLATVLICTWMGLLGPRRWLPVRLPALLLATVVFVAISAPWFIAMEREHGTQYLYRFFVSENVERFVTHRYNGPRSVFFYVPILLGGLAPWSVFLLLWVPPLVVAIRTRRLRLSPPEAILSIWAAVPLVFYSISVGKQPRYILPALLPLTILLADRLRRHVESREAASARDPLIAWLSAITGAFFMALAAVLVRDVPLLDAVSPGTTSLAAGVICLVAVTVAVAGWRRPDALFAILTIGSIATLLSLSFSVFSAPAYAVQRMAVAFREAHKDNEPSGTYHVFVRNLVFYTGVQQTNLTEFGDLVNFLRQPDRVLCVLRQRDLEQLRAEAHLEPNVLASIRYLNQDGLRLTTMFWPEPDKDIEDVHLVSNR